MREFDICGLGNAIVDIFLELSDPEFAKLGFERGTMRLVEPPEQQALIEQFRDHEPRLVSGGSVANSIIAFSQLGGQAAFLGCVGDDRYGLHYQSEFEDLHIDMGNPAVVGEPTGTCLVLITPDAERTMRTSLAVSSRLTERHVDENRVKNSRWLFIEGYLFANPETGQKAIRRSIQIAKQHGVKVAITCSEAFIVELFGDPFFEALKQADLLFANATEACAVAGGATNAKEAFAKLKTKVPSVVVTDGPNGCFVRHEGVEVHIPAFACEPKDLTGAGDMLAGSFLYGISHGIPADHAARASCFLAMKVISQIGARLHHGTKMYWEKVMNDGR